MEKDSNTASPIPNESNGCKENEMDFEEIIEANPSGLDFDEMIEKMFEEKD